VATTLKLTIQIFWATFGLLSAALLVGFVLLLGVSLMHLSLIGAVAIPMIAVMISIAAAITFWAYRALFHFSPKVIGPTIVLNLIWPIMKLMHWSVKENDRFPMKIPVQMTDLLRSMIIDFLPFIALFLCVWIYPRLRELMVRTLFCHNGTPTLSNG